MRDFILKNYPLIITNFIITSALIVTFVIIINLYYQNNAAVNTNPNSYNDNTAQTNIEPTIQLNSATVAPTAEPTKVVNKIEQPSAQKPNSILPPNATYIPEMKMWIELPEGFEVEKGSPNAEVRFNFKANKTDQHSISIMHYIINAKEAEEMFKEAISNCLIKKTNTITDNGKTATITDCFSTDPADPQTVVTLVLTIIQTEKHTLYSAQPFEHWENSTKELVKSFLNARYEN